MTPDERQALKDLIRQFKNPEDSDFDAAINVIAKHAATIRALQDNLDHCRSVLRSLLSELDDVSVL